MNTDAMRDLISQVRADRADLAARLSKADKLLANLRDMYPEHFASTNPDRPTHPRPMSAGGPTDGGTAAIIPATDTTAIVESIFEDAAKVPGWWLSPKEVAENALDHGWKPPSGSPDPVAVIRNRVARMKTLSSRRRDGRTKEYRLKTSGDAAPTASPESVPTTRSGGDEDETAPSSTPTAPQDHGPTSGERDDRDHHRLADDRVAVEF